MKNRPIDTILLVDDLRTNRMVMKKALEHENYTFFEASNGQEAIEIAIEHQPNIIIMDGVMPVMDGFESVKILRTLESFKRTPIIMISSLSDEVMKLKAIEVGVNDFISKPFQKMELILRCRSYMEISHINSQYIISTKDPHTKMPNKVALQKVLMENRQESIVIMRIDSFHSVDTFYGEEYARLLEKKFVSYLISYFHSLDLMVFCYHTGAGEFVIRFDNYERDMMHMDLHQFCEMLHEHIMVYEIELDKIAYDVSATLCFAQGAENLFENASFALDWTIKNKQRYTIMNEVISQLKEETQENIARVHMVKKAIEEDRIVPYFQPIFDNHTCKITKYETLVRLIKEDGKVLSPYFFLDAAKNGNYYLQITQIMIEKVFAIFKYVETEVTINLSYLDISSMQVKDKVINLLESNRDVASRVTFELLEDEAIDDDSVVEAFIEEVRQYGVKIAIDDFGSGYSNFQRIMKINPDFVKIDGSIIKHLKDDKKSEILTKAINTFSHSLGIKTVAEFVYDKETYEKVSSMDIDFSQGYYISEPQDKLVTLPLDLDIVQVKMHEEETIS